MFRASPFALRKDIEATLPCDLPVDKRKLLVQSSPFNHLYADSSEFVKHHLRLTKHVTLLFAARAGEDSDFNALCEFRAKDIEKMLSAASGQEGGDNNDLLG